MQKHQLVLPKGVTIRGSTREQYGIEDLLGKGEMSAVYLVRDRRKPENIFALKEVINPDKHDRERFLFEAQVLKRLHHSALPRVYRIFENNKLRRVYILMDYIEGRNLEELRQQQPDSRFSLPLVIALLSPIVKALTYLHAQDPPIIHRDIKPANVIIPVGADEAMLVDFGSAKEYLPGGTATIVSRRTPGYAAPEQYGSGTGPRTDIYGLGATLYTLLTGTPPVDALSRTALNWNEGLDPLKLADTLAPSIPLPVARALQRAMSLASADRFATVEAFWQEVTVHTVSQSVQIPRITSVGTSAERSEARFNPSHPSPIDRPPGLKPRFNSSNPSPQQSEAKRVSILRPWRLKPITAPPAPQNNKLIPTSRANPHRISLAIWRGIIILIIILVLAALAIAAIGIFHN